MWRERTFSVGENLGHLRSQRPMALGKSLVDHAVIFTYMKVTYVPLWVLGIQNYTHPSVLILLLFLPLNLILQQ